SATGELHEGGVKFAHLLRRGAFLRAVHRGRAGGAVKGIGDVTCDRNLHPLDGAASAVLNQHDAAEVPAAQRFGGGDGPAVFENDGKSARLGGADAAVHGGASADSENAVLCSQLCRGDEKFTRAEGGGRHRVAIFNPRDQRQSAGRRHLDDGGFT